MKRRFIDMIGGIWVLITLGWQTRFRLHTPYWKWRRETAFGDYSISRRERFRAVYEYGKWVYRMRRLMKEKP